MKLGQALMQFRHSSLYHSVYYKAKQAYSLALPLIEQVPGLYRYKKDSNPDIMVYSSRRGGSTLLSQVLSMSPGIRYIDQPFDLFDTKYAVPAKYQVKKRYLPEREYSQFFSLTEEEQQQVRTYLSLLTNGKLIAMGHYRNASRSLLKICNAMSLIDFLTDEINPVNLFMTRHPIPQTLSILRNKWGFTSSPYLKDQHYCDEYLPAAHISAIKRLAEEGTALEKGAINWCLENNYILKYSRSEKLHFSYEALVLDPETVHQLASYCGLENVEEMIERLDKPSKSSLFSERTTRDSISKGDKKKIIEKWKQKVSQAQIDDVQNILNLFEIDAYAAHDPFPRF